jgi:hypothetical protein
MFPIKTVKNVPKVRAGKRILFGIIVSPSEVEAAIIIYEGKDTPALAGGAG